MDITDKEHIKSITINHPELFAPDAAKQIEDFYYFILEKKKRHSQANMDFIRETAEIKELEKTWSNLAPFVNIEFESKHIDYERAGDKIQINIVNEADARNKH